MNKKINVAELFAGVGGFRVGLERAGKNFFNTVYANQWEPSTKVQHAFDCYVSNFGETNEKNFHDNTDIMKVNDYLEVNANYIKDIVNEEIDLVVGGFPCQDYSVATTKAKGIQGKKGVLWWEIDRFVKSTNPRYLLLENVDRLLRSPSEKRGRDFLVMLSVLNTNGYNVEWRVVNASEYGFVQRRKRVFIFAQKRGTKIDKEISYDPPKNNTILTRNLKIESLNVGYEMNINDIPLQNISDNEEFHFSNYGFMKNGHIRTFKVQAKYDGDFILFDDILEKNVDKSFYLSDEQKERLFVMKDGGKRLRTTKDGSFTYYYSEGRMHRHDNDLNRPSRTMLTSEGTINRSSHIVKDSKGFRFITPIEAERLNGFADNWTNSIPYKNKRYFTMGNALVTNVVEEIGKSIKYYENKK